MSDAQAALIRRKKAAEGVSITYTRRSTSYALTGWIGRGMQTNAAQTAARVEISDREFFFAVADFATAGIASPATPQIGDRLTVSGESTTWEVQTPDTGEKAWRYSDSQETIVRLHTKQVK